MKRAISKLLFMSSFIFITMLLLTSNTLASPARNTEQIIKQPNGQIIKVQMYGDERFNWSKTENGDVLVRGEDGYWYYAKLESGKLKPNGKKYGIDPRPSTVLKHADVEKWVKENVKSLPKPEVAKPTKVNNLKTLTRSFQVDQSIAPQKLLVILVDFKDVKIKYSDSQWSNLFFGTNGSTLRDYYSEMSNGKFYFIPANENANIINDGIIKVSLNYTHPNTGSYLGYANEKIVSDALEQANSYIDFSQYDTNQDGGISIDELHIATVIAGYEASYSQEDYPSVWAHRSALVYPAYLNNTYIGDASYNGGYIQIGEIHHDHMATVGIIAHELAHDLGLPDLYDYGYDSLGVGIHSLMGTGNWAFTSGYPGSSPTHLDAWSKIMLGFVKPTIVNTNGNYMVNAFNTGLYNVLLIPTSNSKEYFLIENREFVGFDKGLSDWLVKGGVAIWHINEAVLETSYWRPNEDENYKGIDLEEANQVELGYSQLDNNDTDHDYDHYFYATNHNAFNATTIPNSNLYNNEKTNISVLVNSDSSSIMSVNIANDISQTTPLQSNQIFITNNNYPKWDSIVVKGLKVGDRIKVYNNKGAFIAISSPVPNGKNQVVLYINQLGTKAGTVYLSLTNVGLLEGAKVAKGFLTELTPSLSPRQVYIKNSRSRDYVKVNGLRPGDVVKVYNSKGKLILRSKPVSSRQSSSILYISQIGKQSGYVYVTVTRAGYRESGKVRVGFSAER